MSLHSKSNDGNEKVLQRLETYLRLVGRPYVNAEDHDLFPQFPVGTRADAKTLADIIVPMEHRLTRRLSNDLQAMIDMLEADALMPA